MANTKKNNSFPKKTIEVRVTALPSGEQAVTYNLEQSVQNMIIDHNSAMAKLLIGESYLGTRENSFLAKLKSNRQSLFGDNNSIWAILNQIKTSSKNTESFNNTISTTLKSINDSFFKSVETLDLLNIISQALEGFTQNSQKNNSNETTIDINKDLEKFKENIDEVIASLSVKLDLLDDLYQSLKIEDISTLITSLSDSNQNLYNINKDLRDNIKDNLEGKIRLIFEGLENTSSVSQLIEELSKLDFKDFDKNTINLRKFLGALQRLEELNLPKELGNISKIDPVMNMISDQLNSLGSINNLIDDDAIEGLENLFGNGQKIGLINKIVRSINRVELVEEDKVKDITKSMFNVNKSLLITMTMFGTMIPFSLLWNKSMSKVKYIKIFNDINKLFETISKINPLDKDLGQDINDSSIIVRSILKNIIKFGKYNKKASKVDFDNIETIFSDVDSLLNLISLINTDTNKLSDILTSMQIINSTLDQINNLNLFNLNINNEDFNKVSKVFIGENGSIEMLFNDIYGMNINVGSLNQKINGVQSAFEEINNILVLLTKMKFNSRIAKFGKLDKLKDILVGDENSIKTLINDIYGLKSLEDKKSRKLLESLNIIVQILDGLDKASKKKIKGKILQANIQALEEFIVNLGDSYKKIEEKFNDIIRTSELVERVKSANETIKDGLDNCTKTAVDASKNNEDIQKGSHSLEGLTTFMIGAAAVMTIGALFMMLGGGKFVQAALGFGATLMAFEVMIIAPILLFRGKQAKALAGLEGLSDFVITCSTVMMIGALFMMLGGGKLIENSLAFGITLGFFELLVVSPFLAFYKMKSDIMKGLNEFSGFLITCTVIMLVGALFMHLSNGKMVKSALKFAIVLGLFELLVVSPFLAFGLIKSSVMEGLSNFNSFIITCTVILMIGALFMSIKNGLYVKNSIKFASVLMLFEAMIIAPFLLMNLFKSQVFRGMESFSGIVITCTVILMIGALFMNAKGGLYVKSAMKFTLLLMSFEIAAILPFLLFNYVKSDVLKGLISFSVVVIIATTVLMVGAMFMTLGNGKYPTAAIEFGVLLSGFVLGMSIIAVGMSKWLGQDTIIKMQEFGIYITLCTASLIIGALFITQFGSDSIWEFGKLLFLFTGFMAGIATGLTKWLGKNEIIEMEMFGHFVLLSSAALLIGALFVNKYGVKSIYGYGIALLGFVTLMGLSLIGLSYGFNYVGGIPIADSLMIAMGSFLLMSTASLVIGAWFVETYGVSSVFKYGIALLGFITVMGGVFMLLGALSPLIILGSTIGIALGAAILTLTTSFMLINAIFMLDPGGKNLNKNLDLLKGIIWSSLPFIFAALGVLSPFIALGSVAALAIGVSMLVLDSSFELINIMMGKHGEELKKNIGILNEILGWNFLGSTYLVLGLLSPFILLATPAVMGISMSMLMLGGSFSVINKLIGESGNQLKPNIIILQEILGDLKWTYSGLSLLYPFILGGSIAAIAIGVSMQILGKSLSVIHNIVKSTNNELIDDITYLISVTGMIGLFSGELILLSLPMTLALTSTGLLKELSEDILVSTLAMYNSVKELNKVGNIDKSIEKIISDLDKFISIPDSVISFEDLFIRMPRLYMKLDAIESLAKPMSHVMLISAEAIQSIAELKVPTTWDKEGNPIGFRQLKKQDFDLATDNISKLLYTMANAFTIAWEGGDINGIHYKGLSTMASSNYFTSPIYNTLYFGKNVGEVIKSIGEGVGAMAKMQIPIAWDDKGHAIGYRQLKPSDFNLAGENVSRILTTMASTFASIWNNNLSSFIEDEDSPFWNVIGFSKDIGEVISNIADGVGKLAKMQIATSWDDKGHAISYRTLKEKDFIEAGNSVGKILTAIVSSIASLYASGKDPKFGASQGKNIFDMEEGWFSDSPGPFEKVLGFSFKISELIANIGKGIKDIALMQIPVMWDDKGKPISYEKLTESDFNEAGRSIGTIISAVATEISKIDIDEDQVKNVLESLKPASELVAGMSEGIVKLAVGQIPIAWDSKTGKPIDYRKLTMEDYIEAGVTISTIINCIAEELIKIGSDDNGAIKKIFNDDGFKNIVESISSTAGLISSIADSVIKIGQSLIPTKWDKDGKPIWYEHFNIEKAKTDLETTLRSIITSICETIINIYEKGSNGSAPLKNLIDPGNENSPFIIAVRGISEVTKIVSNLTDSIIKIGQAQIPTSWDKNGKPIKYDHINVQGSINDIKKIFGGDKPEEGLLGVLCSIVNTIYDTYFTDSKGTNITNKIQPITQGTHQIIQMVSGAAELIEKIGNMNLPTSWDNDGNAKGFKKVSIDDIGLAKITILSILTNLLSIPNDTELQSLLKEDEESKNIRGKIVGNINDIGGIVLAISSNIKTIENLSEALNPIFKYKEKSKYTGNNENLTLGIFRDIYSILTNYEAVLEEINRLHFDQLNQKLDIAIQADLDDLDPIVKVTDDLQDFIDRGINPFTKDIFERFTLLKTSINDLYNVTNSQKEYGQAFKKNSAQLSNYIKSINTIDIRKTNSLTMLVRELNKLSDRMGNLDGLTNAIAEKLSTVLEKLVNSLNEAKDTINTADTIQTKRHNAIQKTIREVKEIMDNPISIKVSSDTTESQDDGTSTDSGSSSSPWGQYVKSATQNDEGNNNTGGPGQKRSKQGGKHRDNNGGEAVKKVKEDS